MRRGSFELMKKMNQQLILKLIYDKKTISRAEIAEIIGLSPAAVTNIVKELFELELLRESSRGESRGGRKPVMLEINPTGAYFIGLEWGIAEVRGVLMDLNKKILSSGEEQVDSYKLDSFIELSSRIINKFKNDFLEKDKIYGLGLGVHGVVDPKRGYSLFAPHFKWTNLPLKDKLEEKFNLPVLVDNDVRVMALAEKWNGRDNFIFINTGSGIGAAIVLNGRLHYGRDFSAGEFGHMSVIKEGPECSCGNKGCLEALISVDRLVKRYNPELVGMVSYHILKREWDKLLQGARTGNSKAVGLLNEAVEYLGSGLANLVNLLNPEEILIGGQYVAGADILLPLIKRQVTEKTLLIPGQQLQINITEFGQWVGAIGGATMVLQYLFNFEEGK